MTNDIVKKETNAAAQTGSPEAMIQQAIASGADLEKLEKLLELQLKWEANNARKAYVKAMAAFKENPPKIEKDKKVSFSTTAGLTEYSHASLANVTEKINTALSVHGLSAAWTTDQQDNRVSVTCKITHDMGHSESTTLSAMPDDSGKKNKIQQIASTITYLQRYTLLALCGLATYESDDDGMASCTEYITDEQAIEIDRLVTATQTEPGKFLAFMGVDTYNLIKAKDYKQAIVALENKLKGMKK